MIKADRYYKENLKELLDKPYLDENPRPSYKDGTKAHTYFITQIVEKYDINKNEFPITTLRNTAIKTGIKEIMWIYQKQSNSLKDAHDMNIKWWDEWDVGNGTIGQRYGATVKKHDLINKLLKGLKENPFGRRHIMSLYQEDDLNETKGLYPCAYETIWSVRKQNDKFYLDMTLVQRSNDYIMAGYINKIQYVALQMMICCHLGYEIGTFVHYVQNLHIYDRHKNAMNELLDRTPLDFQPTIELKCDKLTNFYDIKLSDFIINTSSEIQKIKSNLEIAV